MKKSVYLVQPANQRMNAIYLPYSIGALAAYSWQFEDIQNTYVLEDFIFLMKDISEVMEQIHEPYLMAFSCYMWNVMYNLALAEEVKKKYPDCYIVFGGPDVPENESFLIQYPFINFLIFGEGEEPFYHLLTVLKNGTNLSEVKSIAYRLNGQIKLNKIFTPADISNYPSPYLEGFFDHIINNLVYQNMSFDVVFETNRGCPYKCLYCSWGTKDAPVRKFSIERVKGELKWIAKHRIEYCVCADGNFGIFDRDEEIVRYLIEQKSRYGYPLTFETTTAKNKNDFVFRINCLLGSAGLNRGISVACQSLNPIVLKNMHRNPINLEDFAYQIKRYREAGIVTYTDLIMGLPGETLESYCDGLFKIIEAGQHFVQSYRFELLPTSPIYQPSLIKKYGIKTIRSSLSEPHTNVFTDNKFGARSEVVVKTNTMTEQDWIDMNKIYLYTQTFLGLGILKYIAVYLRRSCRITFQSFFMGLYNYIEFENDYLKSKAKSVTSSFQKFLLYGTPIRFYDERFGSIYWNLEEGLYGIIAAEKEEFFKQIKPFLLKFISDESILEDLLLYQKSKIAVPFEHAHKEEFRYDWEEFFSDLYNNNEKKPKKSDTAILFKTEHYNTMVDFAHDVVWLGKRREKTIVKSVKIDATEKS